VPATSNFEVVNAAKITSFPIFLMEMPDKHTFIWIKYNVHLRFGYWTNLIKELTLYGIGGSRILPAV